MPNVAIKYSRFRYYTYLIYALCNFFGSDDKFTHGWVTSVHSYSEFNVRREFIK